MNTYLFAARSNDYEGIAYNGTIVRGKILAVVLEEGTSLPPAVADFVSDVLYWLERQGDKPSGVVSAQTIEADRLVRIMTKTLEEV